MKNTSIKTNTTLVRHICIYCGRPDLEHEALGGACPKPFGGFSKNEKFKSAAKPKDKTNIEKIMEANR